MKKQGDLFLKIIAIVLTICIVAYGAIRLLHKDGKVSYVTQMAMLSESGDVLPVEGYIVRSETIITSNHSIVVSELAEGQRVGAKQRVATGYTGSLARERRETLKELNNRKSQLEVALTGLSSSGSDTLENSIINQIIQLSQYTATQNSGNMANTASELRASALRASLSTSDADAIHLKIEQIDKQIEQITAQVLEEEAMAIVAPSSGYYSEAVDGFENVLTPDVLKSLSVKALSSIKPESVGEDVIGKVITDQTWYYITMVGEEYRIKCAESSRLTISFASDALQKLSMKVEYISDPEDGKCVMVLSYGKQMQNVTSLREQSADITFQVYEGLSVPSQGIYVVDGKTGVYVLENQRARWKEVDILCEYDNGYIVKWDNSSTNNLWPKDEIILTSADIYNRMVVE